MKLLSDRILPSRFPLVPVFLGLMAFWATGCTTFLDRTTEARHAASVGSWDRAAGLFEEVLETRPGREKILLHMEAGLCRLYAGDYDEAIAHLRAADNATEAAYTRVHQQAGSLLLTDNLIDYRPPPFEVPLINSYSALAFVLKGDWAGAFVEARRANLRMDQMRIYLEESGYRVSNPFGSYLSGVLYEMQGELDEAYLDYKEVDRWTEGSPVLGRDLIRLSRYFRFTDDLAAWEAKYGALEPETQPVRPGYGELIVFLEVGASPLKMQPSMIVAIPELVSMPRRTAGGVLRVDGEDVSTACRLADLDRAAREQLDAQMAAMAAKQFAVTAGKIYIADRVGNEANSDLATFMMLALFAATNQADTRSWTTLPAQVHVLRASLPAGERQVTLDLVDHAGWPWKTLDLGVVNIPDNGRVLRSVREQM